MTLSFKLEGDILEVYERIYDFRTTKTSWWYYDIKNWRCSSTGKQGAKIDRDMTQEQIAWVFKHYLPKARITA